ncbi:uncharacterized protein LODBEIA_P37430 [Lodderomyces beijingensis]|uniref:Ribosomal RNA-processing protein 8 n=1 Tax=Lodderomyces beijingensis TaxID=1775926 RepID=A0ABP0ZN17_9ASCO
MLFETKGWNLKNDKNIAMGGVGIKRKTKKNNKKAKSEAQVTQQDIEGAVNPEREDKKSKSKPQAAESLSSSEESSEETEPKQNKKRKVTQKRDEKSDEQSLSTKRSKTIQQSVNASTTPVKVTAAAPLLVTSQTKLTPLQQKMMSKLSGSRFRWINEQLYTITSEEALKLIKEQPSLFDEYHQGFRSQVETWPENPVDVFVSQFKQRLLTRNINAPGGLPGNRDRKVVVADMGCGEAQFAADVDKLVKQQKHKLKKFRNLDVQVHSFDLKKHNDRITVADIKNVPIRDESATIVIFCLALMGTNFLDFIKEAYRILQPRGELWIAEIKSRFSDSKDGDGNAGQEFVDALKLNGFFHKTTDNSNKMFTRFEFFKPPQDILDERNAKLQKKRKFIEEETDREKLQSKREARPEGEWLLKPCIYKRR